MPIPILYFSRLGGLGGGETTLLSHLQGLERARFSPYVVCGKPGALVDELRASNIPVEVIRYTVPYFKRGFLPVLSLDFFPRVHKILRAHQIRLVHCNDIESMYYAAPVARLSGIPVAWTCHAWWIMERGWKSAFVEKMCARIMTPTVQLKKGLVEINPRLERRISVIPFGVDTTVFSPRRRTDEVRAEFSIATDAPIITVLARYQSVKGHMRFLDAAPQILDACPNARILFVGGSQFNTQDARETYAQVIARIEGDTRLSRAIVLAGFRRDVARMLNATDVLVSPSDFETFGMSILEAMACGVPVVSTNVGGPNETMVDGVTGYLVSPDSPDALAKRVIELLKQPEVRARFGKNARARVEQFFTLRDSLRAWESFYGDLVS